MEQAKWICKISGGYFFDGENQSNAGGQSLLLDILYTMGNNRGMKVQTAIINRLSRIRIWPPNHFETLGMEKGDQA